MGVRDFFRRLTRTEPPSVPCVRVPHEKLADEPLLDPIVDETGNDVRWAFATIKKLNRRRRQLTRRVRKWAKLAIAMEQAVQNHMSAFTYERKARMEAEATVEALTRNALKGAGEFLTLSAAHASIMDEVFAIGMRAGSFQAAGNVEGVEQCRVELASVVTRARLLAERCYLCNGVQNLRGFMFDAGIAINVQTSVGVSYRLTGDGREHALCETCHCKLVSGGLV